MKSTELLEPRSRPLRLYSRAVAWVSGFAVGLAALGLLLSLVLIGWAVVMRYVFNQAPIWVDDVVGFLLVAIVMLSAASTYRRDEHIGVDLLISRLKGGSKRVMLAWSALTTALVALVLMFNGLENVALARMLGLLTEGHLEWPQWLLMLLLPVGGALLLAVAIEAFWRGCVQALPESEQEELS